MFPTLTKSLLASIVVFLGLVGEAFAAPRAHDQGQFPDAEYSTSAKFASSATTSTTIATSLSLTTTPSSKHANSIFARYPKLPNGEVCPWLEGAKPGDVLMCNCYNNGYGVDRYLLIDAIVNACLEISALNFGPTATLDKRYLYHYTPKHPLDLEFGTILVRLQWAVDPVAEPNNQCSGIAPYNVDYNTCLFGMHAPIDRCDTTGENGKHGGYGVDVCLAWTVDPNPNINNPGVL